jgi:hypothetical protein
MQKGALKYSNTCKVVNNTASNIVKPKPIWAVFFAPLTIA